MKKYFQGKWSINLKQTYNPGSIFMGIKRDFSSENLNYLLHF